MKIARFCMGMTVVLLAGCASASKNPERTRFPASDSRGNCQIEYLRNGQTSRIAGTNFGNGSISLKNCISEVHKDFVSRVNDGAADEATVSFGNSELAISMDWKSVRTSGENCQIDYRKDGKQPSYGGTSFGNGRISIKDCFASIQRDFLDRVEEGIADEGQITISNGNLSVSGKVLETR